MTGSVITNNGHKIILNRTFKTNPDYSAPTTLKLGTGTTDPTASDTDLETEIAGFSKTPVSGYPILDETNLQATFRFLVLSTEANTNNVTETAIFNTDGTPLMWGRATNTSVTKNTSTQLIITEKDKAA